VLNAPPLAPARIRATPPPPWPAGVTRLLSVGRLHPQKGFDRLLLALAHPSVRALQWQWRIAGDGPQRDALLHDAAARSLGDRVSVLAGYPAALLYPTADLVLSPSRFEGMPLVPLEAVEAGVAWAGSSIGPHREMFSVAPGSILPESEADWPVELHRLIRDSSARIALAAAQHRGLPNDPRRTMWAAYAALYRDVTSE
jgi:glycosyltransferase involved in cell wall biosynthesis